MSDSSSNSSASSASSASGSGSASDASPPPPSSLLTLDAVLKAAETEDPKEIASFKTKGMSFEGLSPDLKKLRNLTRLEAKEVGLKSLENVGAMSHLKHLNVAKNALTSLKGAERLKKLNVLNVSDNQITKLAHLSKMRNLNALVATRNKLAGTIFVYLPRLDTLVVSQNNIAAIEGLSTMTNLDKLSASKNRLKAIPDLDANVRLRELRLNGNRIIKIAKRLRHNTDLRILDLGNNKIAKMRHLKPLAKLKELDTLNLAGNPVCEIKGYRESVLTMLPWVRILDGRKTDKHTGKVVRPKRRRRLHMFGRYDKTEKKHAKKGTADSGKGDTKGDNKRAKKQAKKRKRDDDDQQDHAARPAKQQRALEGEPSPKKPVVAVSIPVVEDTPAAARSGVVAVEIVAKGKDKGKGKGKGKDKGKGKGKGKGKDKDKSRKMDVDEDAIGQGVNAW